MLTVSNKRIYPGLVLLAALLASGCGGYGVARRASPGPTSSPVPLPVIALLSGGQPVAGVQTNYAWASASSSSGQSMSVGGGPLPTWASLAAVTGTPGQYVGVLVAWRTPPPALIVTLLDDAGTALGAEALPAGASNPAFALPADPGRYLVQVTAEWALNQWVSYVFAVEVVP